MAGYARQSSSSIADGETITAAPLNSEFDAVLAAFAFSGGHNHDGSSTEGAYVGILADVDALNKIVVDNTNNRHGFFVEVSSSAVEQIRIQDGAIVPVTSNDIDLGTSSLQYKDIHIDGTAYVDTLEIHVGASLSAGVLSLPDGSASAPVITNTGDTNQGLYFSGTDEMSFTAGGTAQVTFADGVIKPVTDNDVDLGTSSLQFKDIHINGTANIDTLAGTTMSGNLAMGSNSITGLAAPSADGDAARKVYVDDSISTASGLTQLAGNINVNGFHFFGSSGEDIKFKPVGSASILSTQDTDGEFVALVLRNESDAADTTGIASLRFDLEDTSGNTVDAAKIAVKKEASFTSTAATQDSSMVFSTSLNGTLTEYLKLTSAGILEPITDDTVDIGTATKEIKNIFVDGTAYIDAIGFGTTSVTLPGTDGTANQVLKTNGSGTISWADDATASGAQTAITSVLNTSLVVGRDADNDIDFATDNTILFRAGAADQIKLVDGALLPVTDADIDLGSSSLQFKDAFIHGTLEADAITVNGTTLAVTIEDTAGGLFSGNTETGITATYQAADNTVDLAIDAAQTTITSILATDLKIGEDNETKIDFETVNEIHLYANNAEQVYVADGIFGPETDSDVDLGATGVRWKDAFVDSLTITDNITVGGDLTVNGTTTTVNSTTVTIDDPIFTLGGDSAPGSDDNKDRGIEFRWHNGSGAKVGFFGYDDSASAFTFVPDATNSSEVFSGSVGNAIFGNVTGTLQTAAQTNITSVGALDGGSITSNFGTIDTGASAITTTGLISGGSLDIDNVLINGTTIGHTDDTDLLTLANGALTVAGTIEGTTITASTAVVPDASGGADLGSTSLEWGDLYIADDKKIYLGSDQDISIEYDEDGNNTTAVVAAGGVSFAPHGTGTGNGTELRFQELAANGANYVGFKSPDAIASNEVWVLPNADGSADQVLKTDGSNALAWVDQAGGGTVDRVADGDIAIRKPVVLTAAGKAKEVGLETDTSTFSSQASTVAGTTDQTPDMVYEATSGKYVAGYKDTANSNYPTVVAGTWSSDGTIAWGTPAVVASVATTQVALTAGGGRVYVQYAAEVSSKKVSKFVSATISGTTFTGLDTTPLTVATSSDSTNVQSIQMIFDPDTNYVLSTIYANDGAVAVGTTELSTTHATASGKTIDTVYDTTSDRFVTIYADAGNSNYGTAVVHYISNTGTGATTYGTPVVFESGDISDNGKASISADTNTSRVVVAYRDGGDSNKGKAIVGAVTSGTNAISFGTAVEYSGSHCQYNTIVEDPNTNKQAIFYKDYSNGSKGYAVVGTVTGGTDNTISFNTAAEFTNVASFNNDKAEEVNAAFDPDTNKILVVYARQAQGGGQITGKSKVATIGGDGNLSYGAEDEWEAQRPTKIGIAYDETANKFVIAYNNQDESGHGYMIVGTVSGTDATYGSDVKYEANSIEDLEVGYDNKSGKCYIISFNDGDNNLTMEVISISGTTPSVGSTLEINSAQPNNSFMGTAYDSDNNLVVVTYALNSDNDLKTTVVDGGTGTNITSIIPVHVSGTTYTLGTRTAITTGNISYYRTGIVYDPDANRTIIAYKDGANSNRTTANVVQSTGSSSSPTVTMGSDVVLETDAGGTTALTYDTTNNKVFIAYENSTDTEFKGAIGTVTAGTNSISFTTPASIYNYTTESEKFDLVYDDDRDKVIFVYNDEDGDDDLTFRIITTGASSFSVGDATKITTDFHKLGPGSAAHGTGKGTAFATQNNTGNVMSYATVFNPQIGNLDNVNYLGISAAAISDGATGKIIVPGGLSEGHSSLTIGDHYYTNGAGTVGLVGDSYGEHYLGKAISATEILLTKEQDNYIHATANGAITAGKAVVINSSGDAEAVTVDGSESWSKETKVDLNANGMNDNNMDIWYDTSSDKFGFVGVAAGSPGLTSGYGAFYVIAQDTDGALTVTSPVSFHSANTSATKMAYDPSIERFAIQYRDSANSYYGTAVIAKITGTTVTFGTHVVFESSNISDETSCGAGGGRMLVTYKDANDSQYKSKLGVITAGTMAVSFASEVVVDANGSPAYGRVSHDTAQDKFVVQWSRGQQAKARVGSISSNQISYGTEVSNIAGANINYPEIVYDSTAAKHVTTYRTDASPYYGWAHVGTVSGTDISFGDAVSWSNSQAAQFGKPATTNTGAVAVHYRNHGGDSGANYVTYGKISGTTINFGTPFKATDVSGTNSSITAASCMGYNPDEGRFLAQAYGDNTGDNFLFSLKAVGPNNESFVGVATKTVADDEQAEIVVMGGEQSGYTGLTAGSDVYVGTDGTISSTAASPSVVAGKALSANKILIKA